MVFPPNNGNEQRRGGGNCRPKRRRERRGNQQQQQQQMIGNRKGRRKGIRNDRAWPGPTIHKCTFEEGTMKRGGGRLPPHHPPKRRNWSAQKGEDKFEEGNDRN
jgi:hypothetical protein